MQITILHVALIVIICIIAISMIGTRKGKGKASDDKQVAKKGIVGHEQATPMAVRTLAPAFAEQTDWSQFEQPAFLRKKAKPARKRNTQKAEAPVDAKPAQSKQASTPAAETATAPAAVKKTRQTPQQQMEEFRQNSKNRSQKPGFVEV